MVIFVVFLLCFAAFAVFAGFLGWINGLLHEHFIIISVRKDEVGDRDQPFFLHAEDVLRVFKAALLGSCGDCFGSLGQ